MIITDCRRFASTTGEDELHIFARNAGISRAWFRDFGEERYYCLPNLYALRKIHQLGAKIVMEKKFERMAV